MVFMAAVGCAVFLAGSEILTRAFAVDALVMRPLLYYQSADLEAHRPSEDPDRLYELRPGVRVVFDTDDRAVSPTPNPAPRPYRTVTVNSLGFRGDERPAAKPKGTFRIVCLGSSNTYGALVNDSETYPAALERLLNARGKRRYEVWNAGVSAYTLRQIAGAGKEILRRYDPDLLIVQHFNMGRRAFLFGRPVLGFFDRDPGLYEENFAVLPWRATRWGTALLRHWRFYRAVVAAVNRFSKPVDATPAAEDAVNNLPFLEFCRGARRRVPIVLLLSVGARADPRFVPEGMKIIELGKKLPPGTVWEYGKIHPTATVYRWYAETIMKSLREFGFLF